MKNHTVMQLVMQHMTLSQLARVRAVCSAYKTVSRQEQRARVTHSISTRHVFRLCQTIFDTWRRHKRTHCARQNSWSRARRSEERLLLWIPA